MSVEIPEEVTALRALPGPFGEPAVTTSSAGLPLAVTWAKPSTAMPWSRSMPSPAMARNRLPCGCTGASVAAAGGPASAARQAPANGNERIVIPDITRSLQEFLINNNKLNDKVHFN